LGEGQTPFYEPGLQEFMAKNSDRLSFTIDLTSVTRKADVIFIAVDTPQGKTARLISQASRRSPGA
jgi:UDPglucose 6-dehydrogenase